MIESNAIEEFINIKNGNKNDIITNYEIFPLKEIDIELEKLQKDFLELNEIKAFKDKNYIFFHTKYSFLEDKSSFDIMKIENGKVVEHKGVSRDKFKEKKIIAESIITQNNVSVLKTSKNKRIVKDFIKDVLIDKELQEINKYTSPSKKNPLIKLRNLFKEFIKRELSISYNNVNILLGEGDYVLSVSSGVFLNKNVLFYDMFKLKDGKIIEHWDAMDEKRLF